GRKLRQGALHDAHLRAEAHRGARVKIVRILAISGPNLQLLGLREPDIYGTTRLEEIHAHLAQRARDLNAEVDPRQTNHEGTILDWIGASRDEAFDGILINPGAYT